MKIMVKTDKGLRTLGEGRIYSKSQLRLIESSNIGMPSNSGFLDNSVDIANGAQEADKIMNGNSTLNSVNVSGDDATSGKKAGNSPDTVLNVNTKDPNSIKTTQSMMNNLSPLQKSNTDIRYYNGTKQQALQSSVEPKKVMDEMRENSISFTKKELSEFLNSL